MKSVLRLATVDPDERSRNSLKTMLLGVDTVWLEAECSRYEFFMDVVQQTQPDIALVNVDSNHARAVQLVGEVSRAVPNCAVLVVSNSQEGSLILQTMNDVRRMPRIAGIDQHPPGPMLGIELQVRGVDPLGIEVPRQLPPQLIRPEPTRQHPPRPQLGRMVSNVRRRPARLARIAKDVPQGLAEADNDETSRG